MATTTKAQEEYLKRIEEGLGAQAAKGVARAERGFAARGIGRLTGAGKAVGDIASQYAQRIGEVTGRIRAGAEEATAGREFQATEAEKGRVARATEAAKERRFASREAKRARKKDPLDVLTQVAGTFF